MRMTPAAINPASTSVLAIRLTRWPAVKLAGWNVMTTSWLTFAGTVYGAKHVVGLKYLGRLTVHRGLPPGGIVDLAQYQQTRRGRIHGHLDAVRRVERDLHGRVTQWTEPLRDRFFQDRVFAGTEPGISHRFEEVILVRNDLHAVHQEGPRQGGIVPIEIFGIGLDNGSKS